MYKQAIESVHSNLIGKGKTHGLTYTTELLPERQQDGQMFVPEILPLLLNLLFNMSAYQGMATITEARPPRVFPRWLVNAKCNDNRGRPCDGLGTSSS